MKRFVVIATANRGAVDPPEPLDAPGQRIANERAESADAVDREILRRRATQGFRRERDPELSVPELVRLQKPVVNERASIEKVMRYWESAR